jgi:hypothetical protein
MNSPDEMFLERATECERMAELTPDPQSRLTWRQMAERWHRCAKVAEDASTTAQQSREASRRRQSSSGRWMHQVPGVEANS